MQVTLIGSGNVATVLGKQLYAAGHTIREVYSRNRDHAAALAAELGATVAAGAGSLQAGSDLYLLAVTDAAVAETAASLSLGNQLLVHTAGSVSKEVLAPASTRYGVLWPMKMIRKQMENLNPVTLVVDANCAEAFQQIEAVAALFTGDVHRADDQQRLKMHMLASFTSNFTNHIYHLAADYCRAEGIDFSLFLPIIEATVQNLYRQYPGDVQAGPAYRGDRITMEAHLALLQSYPQAAALYRVLSESIAARKQMP